jgi:hypothetical protein
VVSDVHGYRDDLADGLRDTGLVDARDRWCGADARLWVLGDLMDRGPDGIGALELVRSLQEQAPGSVHVLMGNHEALALGMRRFPESRFADSWRINGGQARDQEALHEDHLRWLSRLPVLARVDRYLLMHSDTVGYLRWGDDVTAVNDAVRAQLARGDLAGHWDVWARLTGRYDFAGEDGALVAGELLDRFGGDLVVHGHTIIGLLVDELPAETTGPLWYADGRVLAIDGGRYEGGPLLVVHLPTGTAG